MVVLPPLICAVLSLLIFWYKKMELDRFSSMCLISIYFGYIAYSAMVFGGDAD